MTSLPRAAGAERMDEPGQDPVQLGLSLADLRGVNRWLGGYRVVLSHLGRLVARHPRARYRVLDVATGSADIPLRIAAWARARGIGMDIVATDNHPTTLELARRHAAGEAAVRVEAADALRLPYGDDAFDVALISTALHHFDAREELLRVLGEMRRVARIGGIVNDLRRSRPALAGARLLAATVWRTHPVTAHDGPLSVRRAFTPAELDELARAAGLPGARVHRHEPFRVALVWEREG
ncbi:MAG TPA: methyltransferase domain-containing protein [Longimicrobium sp.]|nr:methyltransferase domain-containing protein [Longimicrobium sp.]